MNENIESTLSCLYNKGSNEVKKKLLFKSDDRISDFSLIQIFKEHREFITHNATQECLNMVFFPIELKRYNWKYCKFLNYKLFRMLLVNIYSFQFLSLKGN